VINSIFQTTLKARFPSKWSKILVPFNVMSSDMSHDCIS
jgi:hypothetical protein